MNTQRKIASTERADILRALKQNTPLANKYNQLYSPVDGALYCMGNHHGYCTETLREVLEKGGCIC